LKVLVVADLSHPDHDLAFLCAMKRYCDVVLFGPDIPAMRDAVDDLRVTAVLAPWPRHRHMGRSLSLIRAIARYARSGGFNVVHVLSEGQVWMNLLPSLLRGVPMVATLHDVVPHPGDAATRRVPRFLVRGFVGQAAAIIVHGQSLRDMAIERLGLRADRVFIGVHPPIRRYQDLTDRRDPVPKADRPFHILFFGRIYPYKGLSHLIAAEPLVARAIGDVVTTIAGFGDEFGPYAASITAPERFDVRNRVIPDDEAAALFARAHVLVLPYVEASQSGVLAVAAACGLPVVATDVGEIGALVRATGIGLLAPPANPQALADALITMASDADLRARCAANAQAALAGPLGDDAVWSGAEAAYRAALRVSRRGARR